MAKRNFVCGYMDYFYRPSIEQIETWSELIIEHAPNVNGLVGTGMSGSLVIPVLAQYMEIDYVILRRENDSSHSDSKWNGKMGDRLVIVDDFVESGRTLERLLRAISKEQAHMSLGTIFQFPVEVLGMLCYQDDDWRPNTGRGLWDRFTDIDKVLETYRKTM